MNKNRAVVALVVIVFVVVISMLYVIFTSNRRGIEEVSDVQTAFEEGDTFDIDNDINERAENELNESEIKSDNLTEQTEIKQNNVKNNLQKTKAISEKNAIVTNSPKTGPGSMTAVLAVVLGTISAGAVYRREM